MKNEVKIFDRNQKYIEKYVKKYIDEATEKGYVIGAYENIKRERIFDPEYCCYRNAFVMFLSIVHNGPFLELTSMDTPSQKTFRGSYTKDEEGKIICEDDFFIFVVNTSLQDYIDYSMCADLYNGIILLDKVGVLKTIKDEFAKNVSESELKTFIPEQISIMDEQAILTRK